MISAKAKIEDNTAAVVKAEQKASFENVRQVAYSIRKDAISTIKTRPKKRKGRKGRQQSSPPGQPPMTAARRGKNLRSAIYVAADMSDKGFESALVGPRASFVGQAGEVHELGKSRGGASFPERPFMNPALMRAVPRMAGQWSGTIGSS